MITIKHFELGTFPHRFLPLVLGAATAALSLEAAPVDISKLPPAATKKGVTYEKDIRPIFEASCLRCHGEQRPKAGLRLDSLEGVLKGGKDGKVIVPGKSTQSQLVIAVARLDEEMAMPPQRRPGRRGGPGGGPGGPGGGPGGPGGGPGGPGGGPGGPGGFGGPGGPGGPGGFGPPPKPLTPEQVGLIRAWVDQGAK